MKEYNVIITAIKDSRSVVVERLCNGVTFINQGATIAIINGVILYPGTPGSANGESFTFGGNAGEIFSGRLDVNFSGANGNVLVIQKIYIK